ncbi:sulfopyruvate decarboxylase subunit alpha [Candidatus Bathyarchaeota archaeon]|nr:sulfopyruvate decarboxylase subunit alpha [Candidatus Bathyarchaeota archaeon]
MNDDQMELVRASKGVRDIHSLRQSIPVEETESFKTEKKLITFLKGQKFDFGVTLPCSKIKQLQEMLEKELGIRTVPVTREEEGIGICTGAHLAGKKPFMLIQSSGLGNSFNAIASLLKTYRIPILILASYRGYYREKILTQVPLGRSLPGMLEAMDVPYIILDKGIDGLDVFSERQQKNSEPHVVLLSPELFENA